MIEYVWLIEENLPGILLQHGAYCSWVRYTSGGFTYEVLLENDEFEFYNENEDNDNEP